jgi:glutamine amidotransferase
VIAVVDYGMGNVRSVQTALEYLGHEAIVTARPAAIQDASHVILPGVGAFGRAMANLAERDLCAVLRREVVERGKPFLGICLGMQLLARTSTEHGRHDGLGWMAADVVRLNVEEMGLKVPHTGWNDVEPNTDHPILAGLRPAQLVFYFVHSFHVVCRDPRLVLATSQYGRPFTAIIGRDNIVATQFHPEKSQDSGLAVLSNFAKWHS